MSPLQLPPADFAARKLATSLLEPSRLIRLGWPSTGTHAEFRSDARYRFDSPDGSYGVLYAALQLRTAFAESVLRRAPAETPAGEQITLPLSELKNRRVIGFRHGPAKRKLRLVKLHGKGLAAAGVDNQISSIDDYTITRAWSKAIHDHPSAPDGILYMSRFLGNAKNIVLFDRCDLAFFPESPVHLLRHPGFANVCEYFELAINEEE